MNCSEGSCKQIKHGKHEGRWHVPHARKDESIRELPLTLARATVSKVIGLRLPPMRKGFAIGTKR